MDIKEDYIVKGRSRKGTYLRLINDNEKHYFNEDNLRSFKYAYSKLKKRFVDKIHFESGKVILEIPN